MGWGGRRFGAGRKPKSKDRGPRQPRKPSRNDPAGIPARDKIIEHVRDAATNGTLSQIVNRLLASNDDRLLLETLKFVTSYACGLPVATNVNVQTSEATLMEIYERRRHNAELPPAPVVPSFPSLPASSSDDDDDVKLAVAPPESKPPKPAPAPPAPRPLSFVTQTGHGTGHIPATTAFRASGHVIDVIVDNDDKKPA